MKIKKMKRLSTSDVSLRIYDLSGRIVKSFSLFAPHSSLFGSVSWDGRDDNGGQLHSGIYFCILETDGAALQKEKIVFVK